MPKYVIGILDEGKEEIEFIITTIHYHALGKDISLKYGKDYDFKVYDANEYTNGIKETVLEEILTDIRDGELDTLIIDYKLMTQDRMEKGSEIYHEIKNTVPKFPAIILTQVVGESRMDDLVDSDKIYDKERFFGTRTTNKEDREPGLTSKEKVFNIFRNMRIYGEKRGEIELELTEAQNKFEEEDTDVNYSQLVDTEFKLAEYTPMIVDRDQTAFQPSELEKTVDILKNVKDILEDLK